MTYPIRINTESENNKLKLKSTRAAALKKINFLAIILHKFLTRLSTWRMKALNIFLKDTVLNVSNTDFVYNLI